MKYYELRWSLTLIVLLVQASVGFSEETADTSGPSRKKGFCTGVDEDGKWLEKIEALHARWFYCWGAKKPEQTPAEYELFR